MPDPATKSALFLPKLVQGLMFILLASLLMSGLTLSDSWQHPLPEAQRMSIRTCLYIIAIIGLPLTNLLRHILLRLNQTMPNTAKSPELAARQRYLYTVMVSMFSVASIGLFGFVMLLLGDPANSLYIFTGMSALGLFLYRPKEQEYHSIVAALSHQQDDGY